MTILDTFGRAFAPALLACLVALAPASAGEATAGALDLVRPWARATPAGAPVGGGYLEIRNAGAEPDRLVGGTVPVAERVEIHEMGMADGVMTMRHLADGLEIPAGGVVTLKPGSYHLMFMGLKRPLVAGETVAGTLTFEKAGDVAVEFTVEAIGATAPAADAHGAGHQGHGG